MNLTTMSRTTVSRLAVVLCIFTLLACSVRLISNYDPQIDQAATTLQKEMDGFLTRLESDPPPSYAKSKQFYDDYAVDLRSVLIRAQSHPKNTQTEKQLALMMNNLKQLEEVHKAGNVSPEVVATMRGLFNQGWLAIIRLEVAKNRGEQPKGE